MNWETCPQRDWWDGECWPSPTNLPPSHAPSNLLIPSVLPAQLLPLALAIWLPRAAKAPSPEAGSRGGGFQGAGTCTARSLALGARWRLFRGPPRARLCCKAQMSKTELDWVEIPAPKGFWLKGWSGTLLVAPQCGQVAGDRDDR